MLPIAEFEKRFRALLEELDGVAEDAEDEDLEDMNAELEDALFMLSEIDPKSDEAAEELADALEEFEALRDDYARRPDTKDVADRLGMLIQMARGNA